MDGNTRTAGDRPRAVVCIPAPPGGSLKSKRKCLIVKSDFRVQGRGFGARCTAQSLVVSAAEVPWLHNAKTPSFLYYVCDEGN